VALKKSQITLRSLYIITLIKLHHLINVVYSERLKRNDDSRVRFGLNKYSEKCPKMTCNYTVTQRKTRGALSIHFMQSMSMMKDEETIV